MKNQSILTREEQEKLMFAACAVSSGASKDQIAILLRHAAAAKVAWQIIELVMDGSLRISGFTKDDFVIKKPTP